MSQSIVPLPVHPWPLTPERDAILRAAKAALELDFLIRPVEAVLGSPGRILSFDGEPPFYCTYAPIRPENANNVTSVAAAMKHCLLGDPESEPFGHEAWMKSIFGEGTRLVAIEPYEGGVRFQ